MRLSMKHNAPIIPVGIVGMEETIRSYADIKPFGKTIGNASCSISNTIHIPSLSYQKYIYVLVNQCIFQKMHKDSEVKEREKS